METSNILKSTEPKRNFSKYDASGTDPNRYATPANKETDPEAYAKQPDNHTAADERMIHPDKGEN